MSVLFLHPDLGIGGAERLVVDAALSLQHRGHRVKFVTSHHDPNHCFQETQDGTLEVEVRGDWLPRHLCGRFHLVFAILRNLYASLVIWLQVLWGARWDAIFVDQLSASLPLLRLTGAPLLFYCHFPDKLLAPHDSWVQRLYRAPLDWLEEITTGCSDRVFVNSLFTAATYRREFPSIAQRLTPTVLYPAINFSKFADTPPLSASEGAPREGFSIRLLSINRFERKKRIDLAIDTLRELRDQLPAGTFQKLQLVVAGGYDGRVRENVEHHLELTAHANALGFGTSNYPDEHGQVCFVRSFTEAHRNQLLEECTCVLYTPENEHFGIVPVEAMYARRPVIATATGGPLESVVSGETGVLCAATPAAFAAAVAPLLKDPARVDVMGEKARRHVQAKFSLETFGEVLHTALTDLPGAVHPVRRGMRALGALCVLSATIALTVWCGQWWWFH